MAKSARRMRHSARRHRRGGMSALAPAPIDGMAAAPAGDAMAMGGPEELVVLGPDDQMALPDWNKAALAEMGFSQGADNQLGGRRRRHSKARRSHRRSHRKGGKRHSKARRSHRRSKRGGCGCGGSKM